MILIPIILILILVVTIYFYGKKEKFYAPPWRAIFKYDFPQSNDFY
jgi:hypothetical protein